MKRLAILCLVVSLFAIPAFADGKPAPQLKGDVYGLPLQGDHAGKALLFVVDRDLLAEYLYDARTNDFRLLGSGRVAIELLANGERAIRYEGKRAKITLIARDEHLEFPSGDRMPRIRDLAAIPVETPSVLEPRDHRLRPVADASPECCGACFGTHLGLTVGSYIGGWGFDFRVFDGWCCGGGC